VIDRLKHAPNGDVSAVIKDHEDHVSQENERRQAAAAEQRRLDAAERQRKIMEQFAKQQSAFAEQYSELYDEVTDDEYDDALENQNEESEMMAST
jgi:hypothetical protein